MPQIDNISIHMSICAYIHYGKSRVREMNQIPRRLDITINREQSFRPRLCALENSAIQHEEKGEEEGRSSQTIIRRGYNAQSDRLVREIGAFRREALGIR